jgi:hypothetical protein
MAQDIAGAVLAVSLLNVIRGSKNHTNPILEVQFGGCCFHCDADGSHFHLQGGTSL